jgi:F0F1-type ATP synthase assembly protein I
VSQAERIKEALGWYKFVFGVLVAMAVSIVGWLAQHYSTVQPVFLVVTLLVFVGLVGGIIWVNRIVFKRLDPLEKL